MEYPQNEAGGAAKKEYNRALRQAFWRKLHRRLGNRCNDLVPVGRLLEQLQINQQRDLGIQQVPLERIVGSGRSRDFDLVFNPKRREQDGRWIQVAQANLNGVTLPPPRLLKIERSYLVVDGNHRISVARAMGRTFIQASVVEIEVENIEPRPACSRLGFHIKTTDDCAANDCR
jgi:hypothetical protein